MISIVDKNDSKRITLRKVSNNSWSFNTKYMEEILPYDHLDLKEESLLSKSGIQSLIIGLKKLINEKPEEDVSLNIVWHKNPGNIDFSNCMYEKESERYQLLAYVDNKCLKHYSFTQEDQLFMDQGYPDPRTHGRTGCCIFVTEENLKKYISELEKEITD